MALLVKCLLYKDEDLDSNPCHFTLMEMSGVLMHTCNSIARHAIGMETGGSPKFNDQSV